MIEYTEDMETKSYNQFCALAYALDVVGERWTLLIVRELLTGPRRFKDLMDGLPGISTNLLTERLKALEQQGILCRRVLPPPAGVSVYALTPMGQALETAVIELGRWGSRLLPDSLDCVSMPGIGTAALAIKAFFKPERASGIAETYQLHIDDEFLQVQVEDDRLDVRQGAPGKAAMTLHTDMRTYMGLFSGKIPLEAALASGTARVDGDAEPFKRFLDICGVPISRS